MQCCMPCCKISLIISGWLMPQQADKIYLVMPENFESQSLDTLFVCECKCYSVRLQVQRPADPIPRHQTRCLIRYAHTRY